jgi:hypothetical protein
MPEVAHSGKDHGDTVIVAGGDHFCVALGATGLNDRSCPGFRGGEQAVGKGEKGVGSDR